MIIIKKYYSIFHTNQTHGHDDLHSTGTRLVLLIISLASLVEMQ